jgi:peroxiredoxin
VLLVFADRKEDLAPLRESVNDLRPLGIQLLGVCNEKARTLEIYNARNPVPFPLLADVTGEISAMYGLYDHAHSSTRPGFLVLDRDGVVRMAVLGQQLPVGDITRLAQYAITGL